MFVKICGITRQEDAAAAVANGASAVGFIFWPASPRCVTPSQARAIVQTLPPFVTPVGVFVNESAGQINAVADEARLGAVQLHGDESPELLAELSRPVVKAVSQPDVGVVRRWPGRVMLLVDAADAARRGGTGKTADWAFAAAVAATRPVLLAGGISPSNVRDAVEAVRPFGIDVSSGVEDAPGIKNAGRIRDLFDALRDVTRA